jgi:hypothetical protein
MPKKLTKQHTSKILKVVQFLLDPCWKEVPDPQQDDDQTCAQPETPSTDTSNIRKRKSHATQVAIQRPSPPADGPSNCPPLPATCTDNPTLLTVWKTYHVSSEETPVRLTGGEQGHRLAQILYRTKAAAVGTAYEYITS